MSKKFQMTWAKLELKADKKLLVALGKVKQIGIAGSIGRSSGESIHIGFNNRPHAGACTLYSDSSNVRYHEYRKYGSVAIIKC